MSKLLFDEQPLIIDHVLARLLGLNGAIVIQQIHYWLEINKKTNKNFYKDRYWVFNSFVQWQKNNFDFWSINTVKRTFSSLEKQEILLVDKFNKDGRDRTKWYTIDYQKLDDMVRCNDPNWASIKTQNDTLNKPKLIPPLPENTPENTPEKIIIINEDDGAITITKEKINNDIDLNSLESKKSDFMKVKDYYCRFIECKEMITFNIEKQLYEYYNKLGLELVIFAIDRACEYNVKNFNYVRGILNNLIKNNITNLEDAKNYKPSKKSHNDTGKELTSDEVYDYIFN